MKKKIFFELCVEEIPRKNYGKRIFCSCFPQETKKLLQNSFSFSFQCVCVSLHIHICLCYLVSCLCQQFYGFIGWNNFCFFFVSFSRVFHCSAWFRENLYVAALLFLDFTFKICVYKETQKKTHQNPGTKNIYRRKKKQQNVLNFDSNLDHMSGIHVVIVYPKKNVESNL